MVARYCLSVTTIFYASYETLIQPSKKSRSAQSNILQSLAAIIYEVSLRRRLTRLNKVC